MAKKEIRVITASDDLAGLIDHGADLDTQIKNVTFEDKGVKAKIVEHVSGQIDSGEISVRVTGKTAAALVTAAESVELDTGAKRLPEVLKAVEKGLLSDFVEKKESLVVESGDVKNAKEILNKAGLRAMVNTSMKISAEALRNHKAGLLEPQERVSALEALKESITTDVTYRVKYEKM